MKKILMALCAVAMLGMVSCNDDEENNPTPNNGGGNGGNGGSQLTISTDEGVYFPGVKISSVKLDGELSETWAWEGNQLQSVTNSDNEQTTFTYNSDGQLTTVSAPVMDMASGDINIVYNGRYITNLTITSQGIQLVDIQVAHNSNNKISHADLDIDTSMVNMLINMLMSMQEEEVAAAENHPVTRLLGRPVVMELGRLTAMSKPNPASKLSVTSITAGIDFVWNGDNVSRAIIGAQVNLNTTLNEINQFVDIATMLEDRGVSALVVQTVLEMIGENELPVVATVADTINNTYDNKYNPLYGYLGAPDIAILSANNVVTNASNGSANIIIDFTVLNNYPINYPLDAEATTYTYTYNTLGFPVTVQEGDGSETQYEYAE